MLRRYFRLDELGTSVRSEILGGLTTFITMAYVVVVHPKILEGAGIPFGPSMVATILAASLGTLLMGVYARRPFAVAPYMGENAFVAVTVVGVLGYTWQAAIAAVFIGGVIFVLISLLGIRGWLANAIPQGLKIAFAVGIGLFLTFIGLNDTGIVTLGTVGAPVHVGDFSEPSVLLGILGFLLISVLMVWRVRAAILIGIITVAALAFVLEVSPLPDRWIGMPPSLSPIFLELDLVGALRWGFFPIILTVFVMDFFDTTGTLIGLSYRARLLDDSGNLPEVEKPMLCDALATVAAALMGTTTTGTYLESAAGIEAGGRSGLSAVVTGLLFLSALFFAPFFAAIPPCAYGPALIIVGMIMITSITDLKVDDLTEVIPVFSLVVLMCFTYNPGIGMTGGFVTYLLVKLLAGRVREVSLGMWILGVIALMFYVFYPY